MTLQKLIDELAQIATQHPELLTREVWLHHVDWDYRCPVEVDILYESSDGEESFRAKYVEREAQDRIDDGEDYPGWDPREWRTCTCVFSLDAE